jgi:hypothetical protein
MVLTIVYNTMDLFSSGVESLLSSGWFLDWLALDSMRAVPTDYCVFVLSPSSVILSNTRFSD